MDQVRVSLRDGDEVDAEAVQVGGPASGLGAPVGGLLSMTNRFQNAAWRRFPVHRSGEPFLFITPRPLFVAMNPTFARTEKRWVTLDDLPTFFDEGYRVLKLWIVVDWNTSPGRRTVVGNSGLFGESGKCWVSRQSAPYGS